MSVEYQTTDSCCAWQPIQAEPLHAQLPVRARSAAVLAAPSDNQQHYQPALTDPAIVCPARKDSISTL